MACNGYLLQKQPEALAGSSEEFVSVSANKIASITVASLLEMLPSAKKASMTISKNRYQLSSNIPPSDAQQYMRRYAPLCKCRYADMTIFARVK